MKRKVNVSDYAQHITEMLPKGILLNTNGDKFNSMVIAWGHLGTIWSLPTFVVYVRQSRYTKPQLDKTGEFSISVPMGKDASLSSEIMHVFGSVSGRDVNKADYVTLAEGASIRTPGIREYPLTLECKVLYQQDQVLDGISQEIRQRFYTHGGDDGDYHTAYIGQIVNAYIIMEG